MAHRSYFTPAPPQGNIEILSKPQISTALKNQAEHISHEVASDTVVENHGPVILLNADRSFAAYHNVLARKLLRKGYESSENYIVVAEKDGTHYVEVAPVIDFPRGRIVVITMLYYDETRRKELEAIVSHLRELNVSAVYLATFITEECEYLGDLVPNFVAMLCPDISKLRAHARGYGFGPATTRNLFALRMPTEHAVALKPFPNIEPNHTGQSKPLLLQKMITIDKAYRQ